MSNLKFLLVKLPHVFNTLLKPTRTGTRRSAIEATTVRRCGGEIEKSAYSSCKKDLFQGPPYRAAQSVGVMSDRP
jgi:hypothetical protein